MTEAKPRITIEASDLQVGDTVRYPNGGWDKILKRWDASEADSTWVYEPKPDELWVTAKGIDGFEKDIMFDTGQDVVVERETVD